MLVELSSVEVSLGEGKINQKSLVFFFFFKAHEKEIQYFFSHWFWKAPYFGPVPSHGWEAQRCSNLACITMQVKMRGLKSDHLSLLGDLRDLSDIITQTE